LIFASPYRPRAEQTVYRWLSYCADADVPELTRLARTIDSWRSELLAYFDTGGVSNGPTEAINLLIKKIKRVGHGFRNFELPAPPPAALRHRLGHYPHHPDQRTPTTLSRVEPKKDTAHGSPGREPPRRRRPC
jgi:hypothetical protein